MTSPNDQVSIAHVLEMAVEGGNGDMDDPKVDLDGAVVRSLILLTSGNVAEFGEHEDPPQNVAAWLRQAEIRAVRGLLMGVLRRWHELRQQD